MKSPDKIRKGRGAANSTRAGKGGRRAAQIGLAEEVERDELVDAGMRPDPHPARTVGHFIWVRAHVAAPVRGGPSVGTRDAPCRRISAAPREASGK